MNNKELQDWMDLYNQTGIYISETKSIPYLYRCITYDENRVTIKCVVPDVKAEEFKIELKDNILYITINSKSVFVQSTIYTISDIPMPVKSKTNAILEYGVLTIELEKVIKDKQINVEVK